MTDRQRHEIPADWLDLYRKACDERQHAYAPYSRFPVGAAIRCESGKIFSGCNIENASSGLTVCAERVAIWKAVSTGEQQFTHLVVVTDDGSTPCGACRQVLHEFAPELQVLVADTQGKGWFTTLADLLPDAFTHKR